jgi:hypothetical protein
MSAVRTWHGSCTTPRQGGNRVHDLLDDQQRRTEFPRVLLFLDASMWLCPNLTLRLLLWADPALAAHMASNYA